MELLIRAKIIRHGEIPSTRMEYGVKSSANSVLHLPGSPMKEFKTSRTISETGTSKLPRELHLAERWGAFRSGNRYPFSKGPLFTF